MKSCDLLPYMNKRRSAEMQRLGKDLEANAIELELKGLELELQVMRGNHARLVEDISTAETERSRLQIRLVDLRNPMGEQ